MKADPQAFILENTRLVSPFLCPEIRLHLITDACPLWYATQRDLAKLAMEDPYWGFCWAGGQVLARYILDHPHLIQEKHVFDFGSGCGVGAIAAMKAGASSVLASDTDPLAVAATHLNARANHVSVDATNRDLIGDPLTGFEVLLAGDMFYDAAFASGVLSWFRFLASQGMTILLADPGRGNLSRAPLTALAVYQAPADVDVAGKHLQKTTVYLVDAC